MKKHLFLLFFALLLSGCAKDLSSLQAKANQATADRIAAENTEKVYINNSNGKHKQAFAKLPSRLKESLIAEKKQTEALQEKQNGAVIDAVLPSLFNILQGDTHVWGW